MAYLSLGLLLAKNGRHDEACHWLRICSQLNDKGIRDPHAHQQTRISALLQWARIESSRDQHRRAASLYHRLLEFPLINSQLQVVH